MTQATAPPADGLTRRAVSGVGWSTGGRVVGQVLQFASGMVLARILSPRDFGLFASALVIGGFAMMLADMGVGFAVIQRPVVTESYASTAFVLNAAAGVALMAVMWLCAPLLAALFHAAEVGTLVRLVAVVYVVALYTVPVSLLQRAMRFRALALVEVGAALAGVTASVLFALAGLGYRSLALGMIVQVVALGVGAFAVTGWRPRARPTRADLRDIWGICSWYTGHNLVDYWSMNADTLLLGATQGKAAVGFYNRAYSVVVAPVGQVTNVLARVMLPALSTVQHERERTVRGYLRAVRLLGLVLAPVFVGLAVAAPAIVETLWGAPWLPAAPLLAALSLAGIPWTFGATSSWLLAARGLTKATFQAGMVATAATLAAIVVGVHWGPRGVAVALCVRMWLLLPPTLWWGLRVVRLRTTTVLRTWLPALLSAAVMALAAWGAGVAVGGLPAPATLLVQAAAGAAVYLALARVLAPADVADLLTVLGRAVRVRLRSAT